MPLPRSGASATHRVSQVKYESEHRMTLCPARSGGELARDAYALHRQINKAGTANLSFSKMS